MLRSISSILTVLALASLLRAEPLDRGHLPATVKWFVHLDLDAARETQIGKTLREALLADPEAGKGIDKARELFGIDPTLDLSGVTVFGMDFLPDSGVVILRGKVDRERVLALLRKAPGFKQSQRGEQVLYAWNEQKPAENNEAPPRQQTTNGAFFGKDVAVIGQNADSVALALDVLAEKSPSLASSKSPLSASAGAGAVIEAGAMGLADAGRLPVESPVLRQCDYGSIEAGERDGQAYLRGELGTRTPEVASRVRSVIEGYRGMAQLTAGDQPEIIRLLSPLKIESSERVVRVAWQIPAVEVTRFIQSQQKKVAAPEQQGKEK